MNAATIPTKAPSHELLKLLFGAVAVAFFLFFIDEGFYDLRWMNNPGNWMVFVAYVILLFAGNVAVFKLMLRNYKNSGRILFSVLGGTSLVLAIIFFGFSMITS